MFILNLILAKVFGVALMPVPKNPGLIVPHPSGKAVYVRNMGLTVNNTEDVSWEEFHQMLEWAKFQYSTDRTCKAVEPWN